ncbi:MAG: hypothetical protein M3386_06045 [Actinomycetota bacterium]|nr:hypothetical protein [Nocardioidaceae bacterium]MDQ3592446.1 hypothetical protein [Actinomycetota bacterium]
MNSHDRRIRALLGVLALVAAVAGCALVAGLLIGEPVAASRQLMLTAAWCCGIATVLLSVAAVQEHANPDDDPRYLRTIVHGFVDEWRR